MYHFTGVQPTSQTTHKSQLEEFARQFHEQTGFPEVRFNDWSSIFYYLADKASEGRITILFDNISWMGSKDPDFAGKIKNAWDIYFKKNPELILILCDANATWIDKQIHTSTGFVGRISYRLTLKELSLEECNEFLLERGCDITPYEKFKILALTGGVPGYLELLSPSLSADENIKALCFTKGGPLVDEATTMLTTLFPRRAPIYKKILKALAKAPLQYHDLVHSLGRGPTGATSEYLDELVKAGLITRDYTWHIKTGTFSKLSQFRLSDNYLRFYFKYIDPALSKITANKYDFTSVSALPGWKSFAELQLKNLVVYNWRSIKERLKIDLEHIVRMNPFFQRKTKRIPGCQIDYLIQTKYGRLFACEIAFSENTLGEDSIKRAQKKIDGLVCPKGFSVSPVLIHLNEIDEDVLYSDYFARIINFGDIFSSKSSTADN